MIYAGFMKLKKEGFPVDAIAPQAAIYLTIKIDLSGRQTEDQKALSSQAAVTSYILNVSTTSRGTLLRIWGSKKFTLVPAKCGTCHIHQIDGMIHQLRIALQKLT